MNNTAINHYRPLKEIRPKNLSAEPDQSKSFGIGSIFDLLLWMTPVLIFILSLLSFSFVNYEYLAVEPALGDGWYYGGYSSTLIRTDDSLAPLHSEASSNFINSFLLLSNKTPVTLSTMGHYAPAERLMTSFGVAMIYRLSLGLLSVLQCFTAWNLLLWVIAILLVNAISRQFQLCKTTAIVMMSLIACEPVFYLMVHSIKSQPLGVVTLLFSIFTYEKLRNTQSTWPTSLITILTLIILGKYGAGGAILSALYIFSRNCIPATNLRNIRDNTFLIFSLFASQCISQQINSRLGIPSATDVINLREIFTDSLHYIAAFFGGQPLTDQKFLSVPGNIFWTEVIPVYLRGIWNVNPTILIIGGIGLIYNSRLRFLALTPLGLLAANTAVIFVHFWHYTYGYMLLPAFIPLYVGFSSITGNLLEKRALSLKVLGAALLCMAVAWNWIDLWHTPFFHLDRYYGNSNSYAEKVNYEFFTPL